MKWKETASKLTKLLRLLVWENYKCLRRPCGTIFREFHFASGLSLHYILLVESSFPSWQFIFAILRNAFKLYAFISVKGKTRSSLSFFSGLACVKT